MSRVLTTVGYVIGPILAAFGGGLTVNWCFLSRTALSARRARAELRAQQWEAAITGERCPVTAPTPSAVPTPRPVPAYVGSAQRAAGMAGPIGGAA